MNANALRKPRADWDLPSDRPRDPDSVRQPNRAAHRTLGDRAWAHRPARIGFQSQDRAAAARARVLGHRAGLHGAWGVFLSGIFLPAATVHGHADGLELRRGTRTGLRRAVLPRVEIRALEMVRFERESGPDSNCVRLPRATARDLTSASYAATAEAQAPPTGSATCPGADRAAAGPTYAFCLCAGIYSFRRMDRTGAPCFQCLIPETRFDPRPRGQVKVSPHDTSSNFPSRSRDRLRRLRRVGRERRHGSTQGRILPRPGCRGGG